MNTEVTGATPARAERGAGRGFYGWKLAGFLWLLYFLNMGFCLYGGIVISTYMLRDIPMDRSTYGLAFTLINLFIGVPSTLVAAAIVKWSVKTAFGIGAGLLLVGSLWMAFFATAPWHFLVAFGLLIGTGLCFSTIIPVTTTLTRWFRRYRGRAIAISLSASGFAGFFGSPLVDKILAANGGNWRQGWQVVAGVVLLSGILAMLLVKERPEDLGQEVDGTPEMAGAGTSSASARGLVTRYPWTAQEAYRTNSYWLIFLGGIACQFPFFIILGHWILYLKGVGVTAADAAWAMGLFTMGGIAGRLIGGWLMDRVAARFAFIAGLCCAGLGSFLAIESGSGGLAAAFSASVISGIGWGWSFVCLNTTTAQFYGPLAFPRLNGMMMMLVAIAASPSPMIAGKLFDRYGSYTSTFELNILMAALGIVALLFAKMPRPPEEAVTRVPAPERA